MVSYTISRRVVRLKIYSELFPVKYLFSNQGICLGADTKRRSFLFIVSKKGILFRKRPVGDKVVEDHGYEIDRIYDAILSEEHVG